MKEKNTPIAVKRFRKDVSKSFRQSMGVDDQLVAAGSQEMIERERDKRLLKNWHQRFR